MSTISNAERIWNTVKYMTPRQWIYRLYYIARRPFKRKTKIRTTKIVITKIPYIYKKGIPKTGFLEEADGILNGVFPTVSGQTISFDNKIDWDCTGVTYRLKCFRINDFKYLLSLSDAFKQTGQIKYLNKGFDLIEDWIQQNSDYITGDKWNPYVIAERLMNWIGFISENAHQVQKSTGKYTSSIWSQAKELKSSVEYQLGANHLLSEGKALMYAGAFLNNPVFYKYGKKLLIKEAALQFLPDGGHYERSISYHVESLQQLFEATVLMVWRKEILDSRFADVLCNAYTFLNGMISTDGHIPLVNDASYDYPFDAADFLGTSKVIFNDAAPKGKIGFYSSRWEEIKVLTRKPDWNPVTIYKDTGYVHDLFEYNGIKHSIYFDVGNCGPDENLGHAHADSLSVLWATEETQIFADSGVFTYEPGNERNYCRSTKAHNTVEIDGRNSSEIWSAFRVAIRSHGILINSRCSDTDDEFTALHDGYENILDKPVSHIRKLEIDKINGRIKISDYLKGKGKHEAVVRYHLTPGREVVRLDENEVIIDKIYKITSSNAIEIARCKVASNFGMKENSICLEINSTFNLEEKIVTNIYFNTSI